MFNIIFKIERWKWNPEAQLWVSTEGRIKNKNKELVKPKIANHGYMKATEEAGSLHRLVLKTWRPIPNAEQMTVDHLNHNKADNSLSNLEWVTMEENQRRAREDLAHTPIDSRVVADKITREGLIKLGTLKPAQTESIECIPPLMDAKSHILYKYRVEAKNMIRYIHITKQKRCIQEKCAQCTKKERKMSFKEYCQKPTTFDRTRPILVSTGGNNIVRYFDNYEKAKVYILNHHQSFSITWKQITSWKTYGTPSEILDAIAEATLEHGHSMSLSCFFTYAPENLTNT